MELRHRLAQLRESRGYSLRELRDKIEEATGERIAISYLSSLERVEKSPSMDTLSRIAAGYGMSLNQLLDAVDTYVGDERPRYTDSLLAFAQSRNLSDSEVESLSRIEYRGRRPETEKEWEAIYGVLRLLSERKD